MNDQKTIEAILGVGIDAFLVLAGVAIALYCWQRRERSEALGAAFATIGLALAFGSGMLHVQNQLVTRWLPTAPFALAVILYNKMFRRAERKPKFCEGIMDGMWQLV